MKLILSPIRTITIFFILSIPILFLKPLFGFFIDQMQRLHKKPCIENVIFDLGNVLLTTNKSKAFFHIGPINLLKYAMTFNNPMKIKDKTFEKIDLIKPLDKNMPLIPTGHGKGPLPQLCIDWLSGTASCQEILERTLTFFENNKHIFANESERTLAKKTARIMFTPEILAKTQVPLKAGIEFIKECKEKGLNVFILSNFDAASFEIIKEQHPELFDLFEEQNIFVSGYFGTVKPCRNFYDILLQETGLDPRTCIFFDDQQVNIDAARELGMHGVVCPKKKGAPNIDFLRKQLNILRSQANDDLLIQEA